MPCRSTMGPRWPNSLEEFAVGGEFEQRIPGGRASQPDVVLAVREDGVYLPWPEPRGRRSLSAPGSQQIAIDVEFQHGRRSRFSARRVARAVQHPDVIVLIDIQARDGPHDPVVRQRLRPPGIEFVDLGNLRKIRRRSFRLRLRGAQRGTSCQSRAGRDGPHPPKSAHDASPLPRAECQVAETLILCSLECRDAGGPIRNLARVISFC